MRESWNLIWKDERTQARPLTDQLDIQLTHQRFLWKQN